MIKIWCLDVTGMTETNDNYKAYRLPVGACHRPIIPFSNFNNSRESFMTIARFASRIALVTAAVLSAACSPNHFIGNRVVQHATENVMPQVMTLDDVTMICHTNESFAPMLMSFGKFGVDADLLLAFSYSGAAICTENDAVEKELWSEQASLQGWVDIAQDARIAQQLLNRDAGKRQLLAYQHAARYFQNNYGYDIGEGKCPAFKNEPEQLLLLIAATSALQALQNDIASGRLIDVDMALPPKVTRAMSCLDNEKWWGEPKALQAGLKVILPQNPQEEAQGWKDLQASTDLGLQSGVRLSHATYAIIAYTKSREDYLRDALKRYESIPPQALNKQYALFDQVASQQIRHIADRLWMQYEHHRAPTQNFSKFWDEKAEQPSKEMSGLLDGL
jgi:hypothetical protein